MSNPQPEPRRFQRSDDDTKELVTTIFDEIEAATKSPEEGPEKPEKSFIRHDDLRTIWSDRWRVSRLLQLDYDRVDNAREDQIDFIQEHMIVILSTLVYASAYDCLTNFRARLFDRSGNAVATDDRIPLKLHQITFLDSERALQNAFYEHQFRFKPVVIEITGSRRTQVIEKKLRLPFEFCERNIGSGGYGMVDRVGISPKCLKIESGLSWDSVSTRFCWCSTVTSCRSTSSRASVSRLAKTSTRKCTISTS
jgi:hypothetical protein